jgi:hypothetical protein
MAEESSVTKVDIEALRADLRTLIGGVREEIGAVEQRLRGEIGAVEQHLREEIAGAETRLSQEIREEIAKSEVKLTKRMDDITASLEEEIRDSQTEVLRAMLTTQEGNLARFKDVDTLRERVAIVERRLLEIEVRLHIPPTAA